VKYIWVQPSVCYCSLDVCWYHFIINDSIYYPIYDGYIIVENLCPKILHSAVVFNVFIVV
jgi:hypothetical protein